MLTRQNYIASKLEIENELLHFFNKNDKLIIFDIGACEAEDSIRYAEFFPSSTIYAFEPRRDNFDKASELIAKYNKSNILLENIALSDKNGTADFFLSDGEPPELKNDENWNYGNKSSSLLPPSPEMKTHIGWLNFHNKITVPTKRLENYILEKKISAIDFMHIDVQGAELQVLAGAGNLFSKIKIIWMEVQAVRLYENQPLKEDVERFMEQQNFVNVLDTVGRLSGDQLYVNSTYFSKDQIKKLRSLKIRKSKFSRFKSFLINLKWR
jgi:FkbM family methyltransferase